MEEKKTICRLEKWSKIKESALQQKARASFAACTAVNKIIMRRGNALTHTQQLQLCEDVTEKEIYSGLQNIGDDKAPGVNDIMQYSIKEPCQSIKMKSLKLYKSSLQQAEYVLAGRIQKVIASTITETHSGFILGKRVADNVIMAHELVKAYTRKHISPRCMIKVDIQKAYDTVDWRFLEQMLTELNFPKKFIRWVMECITTVNYSVVINGE
ncbi:PREDICTED: uncharacterized protein LOC109224354 [Nicotiana attenuata]|uniref:uncharacterized protein LOC109224354 n=1 Tax=Nicotiana attenuata TaxID=49451 RepID=UPI000905186C|nr:PREDICTED: uncharacterized protein LOC109224354 [Nicotiana attenuata]